MTGLFILIIALLVWCLVEELHPKVNQYLRWDLVALYVFMIIVCIFTLFLINRG
jgi:hypothetical protein